MDTQSNYYPYTENLKSIKRFFSRPIVLLCAIFAGVYALAEVPFALFGIGIPFILYYSDAETRLLTTTLSVNPLALAECIGLLILYIKSRSRKFSILKAPLNFLRAVSLISAILFVLALIAVGMSAVYEASAAAGSDISQLLVLESALGGAVAIAFCRSLFTFIWLGSVKKSVCSVYLCRKGSALCAMFSLISTVLLFSFEAFTICNAAAYWIDFVGVSQSLCQAITVQITVITAAQIILNILIAITAIKYNSYIKKCADASSLEPRAVHTVEKPFPDEPSQSADDTDIKSGAPRVEPSLYEKLAGFTPQSVDFSAMGSDNDKPSDKQSYEHKICHACKAQCEATDKFCPRCGSALNKS